MSITYLRNKKASTKTITLKNAQGNTSVIKSADLDVLGGSFRPITESQKNQLNIKYGVEIMKVNSGALKDGGISRGFIIQRINDNNINTIDDLQKAVKSASTSKDPVLYIQVYGQQARRLTSLFRCRKTKGKSFKRNVS